jgi:signal transduction histidine kinase
MRPAFFVVVRRGIINDEDHPMKRELESHAQKIDEQLSALTLHLAARREAILQAWRKAIDRDPELTTGASLPRTQLNDHIPSLLDAFGRKLCITTGDRSAALEEEHNAEAVAHGLQRWQQGYDLREVNREWGRLQLCLVDELEGYASAHPELEPGVMSTARRAWTELCSEGISESTAKYFELQQIEAVGHVRDLEQALEQVHELERQRAELWHEAAHDLRGNLGVVANASAGLGLQGVPEPLRDNFLRILKKNVSSLQSLLEDVTDLARLQAGREQRQVAPFDAAVVLRELCERVQPMADQCGLFLKIEGAAKLLVQGDAVKTQRIAQNLLLNALKYTPTGGVTLSWGDSRQNDANRWMLCVRDTGPGFHAGPGAPMAGALEDATEEARHVEETAGRSKESQAAAEPRLPPAVPPDSRPVHQERGEGIGLSIVKRLCELLDATMEMESKRDEGTTIRIAFPRRYDSAEHRK